MKTEEQIEELQHAAGAALRDSLHRTDNLYSTESYLLSAINRTLRWVLDKEPADPLGFAEWVGRMERIAQQSPPDQKSL
jgi:hypothetical protein